LNTVDYDTLSTNYFLKQMSDQDKKDLRRQKLVDKTYKKPQPSEEQKFISKSKKQFKKKIEEIRGDELWEDWEQDYK
jgi:hypothetical protein